MGEEKSREPSRAGRTAYFRVFGRPVTLWAIRKRLPASWRRRLKGVVGFVYLMALLVVRSPFVRIWSRWRLSRLVRSQRGKSACLHLGCGARHFQEWINIDVSPFPVPPDVLLDLSSGIPLPDSSVDLIYSEDFVEHLEFDKGKYLLSECYRVLKPGGAMRVLTPNLKTFVQAYFNKSAQDLSYYQKGFGCRSFAEMLNTGMKAWGHKFIYDEELLTYLLTDLGFEVRQSRYNTSEVPALCKLDSRDAGEGYHTMYFDCYKRKP